MQQREPCQLSESWHSDLQSSLHAQKMMMMKEAVAEVAVVAVVAVPVVGDAMPPAVTNVLEDARQGALEDILDQPAVCNKKIQVMTYNSSKKDDTLRNVYKDDMRKSITFIVTKDCQLACKYCYLVGKRSNDRMSWGTAKKSIDYILSDTEDFNDECVQFEFIGGEPFLEIDLIDKICDYLKIEMFKRNHKWFNDYVFLITTNGINYDSPKVQNFIKKNRNHLDICITIDGTQKKHDLNRIYKGSNKGSYKDVVRNIPLWLKQFPGIHTKVTISSADIPYIKESVLHLYSLGIYGVLINCVFEDVWKDGDDKLFEDQLIQLADAIIDNDLYESHVCTFFDENLGKPLVDDGNWCGAGMMLAIDPKGNFYPCIRFVDYSLRSKEPIIIGNAEEGINKNLLRPFLTLRRSLQSPRKCMECEVASGCAWCQGENYDAADTPTIFQRSTAICKMHKANVRANNYYWNKLFRKLDAKGKRTSFEEKRLNQIHSKC